MKPEKEHMSRQAMGSRMRLPGVCAAWAPSGTEVGNG